MKALRQYVDFLLRCFRLMGEERNLFILLIVLSVLGAATEGLGISLLVPLLQVQGAENAFQSIPLLSRFAQVFSGIPLDERVLWVSGVLFVIIVLRGVLLYSLETLGGIIPLKLQKRFTQDGFLNFIQVEMSFVTATDVGTIQQNIGGWASRVSYMLTQVAHAMWNFTILIAYIALMFVISWRLTLAAIGFVVVISFLLKRFVSGPMRISGQRLSEISVRLSQTIWETIAGIKLVRLLGAEKLMHERFSRQFDDEIAARRHMLMLTAAPGPLLTIAAGCFICAILSFGALTNPDNVSEWISATLLFLFLLMRLLGPVSTLNTIRARIAGEQHAYEMLVKSKAEMIAARQPNGSRNFERLTEAVRFENVSFKYAGGNQPAIRNLSFSIPRGQTVALVGPSGAGKTTIAGLLSRLYDPQAGRIAIDGIDLRDYDARQWRQRIAVVSQDIFIFDDSVANNIAFGRSNISQMEIERAARMAAAHEFISRLPDGYNTILGDRGVRLSGGQQQRIAIARAILANPDLLILDEATSHLDSVTEAAIQNAVDELAANRTLLVIAHRLSTIKRADTIVVLTDGQIVEIGSHAELIKKCGIYYELLQTQKLDLIDDDASAEQPASVTGALSS